MSMAEDILDGIFCQICGTYLGDGEGYPRSCRSCGGSGKSKGDAHDVEISPEERKRLESHGFKIGGMTDPFAVRISKDEKPVADYWPRKKWFNLIGQVNPPKEERRGIENLLRFISAARNQEAKVMTEALKKIAALLKGLPMEAQAWVAVAEARGIAEKTIKEVGG